MATVPSQRHVRGRIRLSIATLAAALLCAGCAPRADVTLVQPFARSAQRELHLRGGDRSYECIAGRVRCVLELPSPGAPNGPPDFLLFCEAADVATPQALSVGSAPQHNPAGFLIQVEGALAGRTDFSQGTLSIRPALFRRNARILTLDVTCQDGTRITAHTRLSASSPAVRAFERRFAADIARLRPGGGAVAAAQAENSDAPNPSAAATPDHAAASSP